MTQEEKAKRYDEAIEKARKLATDLPNGRNDRLYYVWDLESIFPELKESEDEKTRAYLIRYIDNTMKSSELKSKLLSWLEKQGEQNTNHKTMIVNFLCKKDWHGIGDYCCGKIYNGYPCEKEQKGYDIYDDNHIPTFCDEDFINEYFNIVTEEKQGEQKPRYSIGDVLCDKSCIALNKDAQPNFEITDIRNGMYICDKGSFPISQQNEYELVAKRIEQEDIWSEDDKRILDALISSLINERFAGRLEFLKGIKVSSVIDWLKSLKEKGSKSFLG